MSGRVLGTTAQAQPRRKWPFVVGGAVVLVVAIGVTLAIALQPVAIDDDISERTAREIARLMEAQLDTELAILKR